MGLRSRPLRAHLIMFAYSLGNFNCTLLEVTCVGYQSRLVWIHNDKYNQRVPKPMALVKVFDKGKANTRRVYVLLPMISLVGLPEVLLVVRAMDMVISHLGRRENCLLIRKRKRILGLRLSRNCLKPKFSKGLKPALALIVVSRVISLRHVLSQSPPDY